MWILLGGLETALYQAGFLDVLLERQPAPRVIYGGGVAAINAVLAAQHDPRALRRGWERLRGRRFLALEAIQRAPWMRVLGNGHDRLNGALQLLVRGAGREATASSDVWLLTAGSFVEAMCTGRHVPPLASIDTALHSREITGHALATALNAAPAHGVTRIVAIVDEPLVGGREAGHALEETSARGIETALIPFVLDRRTSLVSYLLPGSGAADRMVAAGRARARAWLGERA